MTGRSCQSQASIRTPQLYSGTSSLDFHKHREYGRNLVVRMALVRLVEQEQGVRGRASRWLEPKMHNDVSADQAFVRSPKWPASALVTLRRPHRLACSLVRCCSDCQSELNTSCRDAGTDSEGHVGKIGAPFDCASMQTGNDDATLNILCAVSPCAVYHTSSAATLTSLLPRKQVRHVKST